MYESPDDAKEAMGKLNGFHLMERYIVGECRWWLWSWFGGGVIVWE